MNKEEKYNQLLREKLEDANFEYNAADWNSLASQLPKAGLKPFQKFLIAASVAVISASAVYYFNNTDGDKVSANQKQIVENNQETIPTENDQSNSIQHTDTLLKDINAEENKTEIEVPQQSQTKKDFKATEKIEIVEIATKESTSPPIKTDSENKNDKPIKNSTNQLIVNDYQFCIGEKLFVGLKEKSQENYTILINGKNILADDNSCYLDQSGKFKIELFHDNVLIDTKTVEVNEASKAVIKYNKVSEEFGKITYQFSTVVQANESVIWTINGVQVSEKASFTYDFKRASNARVEAIISNINGCTNNEMRVISIREDFDILSYDAFTPNGDGINDEFIPKAIEANNLKFEMLIKDLSGNIIYSTTDYSKAWNGRRNNSGEMMPFGTYIWSVNLYDDEGIAHPYNGQIKIIKLSQ